MDIDDFRNADVFDTSDLIARIDELEDDPSEQSEDHELERLLAFAADLKNYAEDYSYGVAVIEESSFEEYAQQLAEEIGAVDPDVKWPMKCIDWKQAARELKYDYSAVAWEGRIYYTR